MADRIPRFLPRDLRELLAFVPTRGWDAIEWKPLLKRLRSITWQLASQDGIATLSDSLAPLVPGIDLGPGRGLALDTASAAKRRQFGDDILRLYFAQWLNPNGMFLDLRDSRFAINGNRLHFRPSGLWTRVDPDFREGMVDLYLGFYRDDELLLDEALWRMGFLHEGLSEDEAEELTALLKTHFGSEQSQQQFSIADFRASFDQLFDFFLEHDYRLRSDFVLVGFYLITLYLVLEFLGQRHDVRRICLETLTPG